MLPWHKKRSSVLPASNRLRRETDIKRLFAKGKGVFDELCGLKFAPTGLPATRFAIVVGTKISKKAVVRNKLKRQVRAILEKQLPRLVAGFDVSMLVRKEALKADFSEIERHIVHALERAKLLKKA